MYMVSRGSRRSHSGSSSRKRKKAPWLITFGLLQCVRHGCQVGTEFVPPGFPTHSSRNLITMYCSLSLDLRPGPGPGSGFLAGFLAACMQSASVLSGTWRRSLAGRLAGRQAGGRPTLQGHSFAVRHFYFAGCGCGCGCGCVL